MYLNDKTNQQTIMRLSADEEFIVYRNWVQENHADIELESSEIRCGSNLDADVCLPYFGFTFEGFLDAIFNLLPAKSATAESNRDLFRAILQNPRMTKSKCCKIAGKNPTHYNRLVQTIEENCEKVSLVTGGRNPIAIIQSIRADF